MVSKSIGSERQIDWETLQRRFPALAFELSYGSYEKRACFYDSKGRGNAQGPRGLLYDESVEKVVDDWVGSCSLESVDVLYVYGTGLGHFYHSLRPWLQEKRFRKLVFFEEDLGMLEALFQQESGFELLNDLQVYVYYLPEETAWPAIMEQCVSTFLSDRIEWTVLPSYKKGREKKLQSFKLQLMRKSSAVHAKVAEAVHYPKLMRNIAENLLHLPRSFHANAWKGKFSNIPAVICGAGYSLGEGIEALGQLENKALLFAGGSAITALGNYGIRPHLAMALDPNEEEYRRLKGASCFEVPFIYSSRLCEGILSSTHVQMGYLCSNTGGIFEAWVHEKLKIHGESFALELGEEALSVTTLATAFAVELGCSPIFFCGVDLSYTNRQRYCQGVMPSSSISVKALEKVTQSGDRLVRRKNLQGDYVHTMVKWVMEASCLGRYAKQHRNVAFFNLSSQGLPIPEVPQISWKEAKESFFVDEYDLRGALYTEAQEERFPFESAQIIESSFEEIVISCEKVLRLLDDFFSEIEREKKRVDQPRVSLPSGKMVVLEMDIFEEVAYQLCLAQVLPISKRIFHEPQAQGTLEDPCSRLDFLEEREMFWRRGKLAIEDCLSFLKSY